MCLTKLWCFTGNATNFRLICNETRHEQRNRKRKGIFYPLIQDKASNHANLFKDKNKLKKKSVKKF